MNNINNTHSFITSLNHEAGSVGDRDVTVNIEPNKGRAPRTNYIKFTTDGGASDIVSITQNGHEEYMVNTGATFETFPVTGGTFLMEGVTNTRSIMWDAPQNDLDPANVRYVSQGRISIDGTNTQGELIANGVAYRYSPIDDSKFGEDIGKTREYSFAITREVGGNEYPVERNCTFYVYSFGGKRLPYSYRLAANTTQPTEMVLYINTSKEGNGELICDELEGSGYINLTDGETTYGISAISSEDSAVESFTVSFYEGTTSSTTKLLTYTVNALDTEDTHNNTSGVTYSFINESGSDICRRLMLNINSSNCNCLFVDIAVKFTSVQYTNLTTSTSLDYEGDGNATKNVQLLFDGEVIAEGTVTLNGDTIVGGDEIIEPDVITKSDLTYNTTTTLE